MMGNYLVHKKDIGGFSINLSGYDTSDICVMCIS